MMQPSNQDPMPAAHCRLCPRQCGADRRVARGRCGAPQAMAVASVCVHRGEEPPLNPIVNVFFAGCGLRCIYCQNWQISHADAEGQQAWAAGSEALTEEELAERICALLPSEGGLVGMVTAAQYADRLPAVVEAIHQRGHWPAVVYNSSGYERVETLRQLEGLVDIYLPDLKYMDSTLAAAYSAAADYPEVAAAALAEMRRQVGESLKVDADTGLAYRGMAVRHLVLPGQPDNTRRCLTWLADHFDPEVLHLSLMAQYFPPRTGMPAPLDRTLQTDEYALATADAERLGFAKGWVQPLAANEHYRPQFAAGDHPFEPSNPQR